MDEVLLRSFLKPQLINAIDSIVTLELKINSPADSPQFIIVANEPLPIMAILPFVILFSCPYSS